MSYPPVTISFEGASQAAPHAQKAASAPKPMIRELDLWHAVAHFARLFAGYAEQEAERARREERRRTLRTEINAREEEIDRLHEADESVEEC